MCISKTFVRLLGFVLGAFVSLGAIQAKAGLLVEPYLGYEMGNWKGTLVDSLGGTNMESDNSGVAIGARIGYTLPALFWFALDYSMVNGGKLKDKSGGSSDTDYDRSTLFAVAGIDLPVLIRGWAGYGFINDVKVKGTSDTTYKGSAIKVGAGFTGLPIVSLNAEYIMTTTDKVKSPTYDGDASAIFKDFKNNTIMLSVSAPFDI